MAPGVDLQHEHPRGVDRAVRLPVHEGAAVVEHLDVAVRQPVHVVLPAEHPAWVVSRDMELVALAAEDPLRPSGPATVLASVKSGAAWPTFKLVCGAAGGALAGAGVGVGVCATAIDAAASRKTRLSAREEALPVGT